MKSEPEVFSIEDLKKAPGRTTCWEGVRNYQARNFLRDSIKKGDGVLYYHSNCETVGIAGEAVVVRAGYPDGAAFDPTSEYFDPKSDPKRPAWFMVDVKFVREAKHVITLSRLRAVPALKKMVVLRRFMRLSVQPVEPEEWDLIMKFPEWSR